MIPHALLYCPHCTANLDYHQHLELYICNNCNLYIPPAIVFRSSINADLIEFLKS